MSGSPSPEAGSSMPRELYVQGWQDPSGEAGGYRERAVIIPLDLTLPASDRRIGVADVLFAANFFVPAVGSVTANFVSGPWRTLGVVWGVTQFALGIASYRRQARHARRELRLTTEELRLGAVELARSSVSAFEACMLGRDLGYVSARLRDGTTRRLPWHSPHQDQVEALATLLDDWRLGARPDARVRLVPFRSG